MVIQFVQLGILGHLFPVNSSHILAPAQNLANKSFHLRNMDIVFMVMVMVYNSIHHLFWGKHFAVHRKGQSGVEQVFLLRMQCILIIPEVSQ